MDRDVIEIEGKKYFEAKAVTRIVADALGISSLHRRKRKVKVIAPATNGHVATNGHATNGVVIEKKKRGRPVKVRLPEQIPA